ncbi:MAG: energy transducer TonB [Nitrospirota bacterium]
MNCQSKAFQGAILISIFIHALVFFSFMGINKSCVAHTNKRIDRIIEVDLIEVAPLSQENPNPEPEKPVLKPLPQEIVRKKVDEPKPLPEGVSAVTSALPEDNPIVTKKPAVAVSEPEKGLASGVEGMEVERHQDIPTSHFSLPTSHLPDSQQINLIYQKKVREKIEQVKLYPVLARRNGIEGQVKVQFTILSNGRVTTIELIKSSGNKILDDAAKNAIKHASPFSPIPEGISKKELQMGINIAFRLLM